MLLDAIIAVLIASVAAITLFYGLASTLGQAGKSLDRVAAIQQERNEAALASLGLSGSDER